MRVRLSAPYIASAQTDTSPPSLLPRLLAKRGTVLGHHQAYGIRVIMVLWDGLTVPQHYALGTVVLAWDSPAPGIRLDPPTPLAPAD